jgi:hypothetical protein
MRKIAFALLSASLVVLLAIPATANGVWYDIVPWYNLSGSPDITDIRGTGAAVNSVIHPKLKLEVWLTQNATEVAYKKRVCFDTDYCYTSTAWVAYNCNKGYSTTIRAETYGTQLGWHNEVYDSIYNGPTC